MTSISKKMAVAATAVGMCFAGAAQAGIGILDTVLQAGNGSAGNAYDFGVLTISPKVLSVTVPNPLGRNCAPNCSNASFEEYANFTSLNTGAMAVSFSLTQTLFGINDPEILNLTLELWDSTHPAGTTLLATFAGNNTTHSFTLNAGAQYHFDISGTFGPNARHGQYAVAISAVPEPETYAMMLAGLGLMGFVARRRRNAVSAV